MTEHNNDARTDGNTRQNSDEPRNDTATPGASERQRDYSDSVSAPDPERKQRKAAQPSQDEGENIPEHAKNLTPEEQMEKSDSALADAESFFVTRDAEGKVRPVKAAAGAFGLVKIRPLTYGQAESYFGEDGDVASAEADVVARVMREHVVEPDLEQYAKDNFGKVSHGQTHYMNEHVIRDEMKSFGPQALLSAIIRESGMAGASVSVNDDGQAQIDFGDSGNR